MPCQLTSPCRWRSSRGVSVGCHSRRKKRVLPVYLSGVTWFPYYFSCLKLFSSRGRSTLASLRSEPERGLKVRLCREQIVWKMLFGVGEGSLKLAQQCPRLTQTLWIPDTLFTSVHMSHCHFKGHFRTILRWYF